MIGVELSSNRSWKLKLEDGTIETFTDIRRKVGNRIIRAYLLKPIMEQSRIERIKATLRGPKDEFKDFDKFFILKGKTDIGDFRMLVESGVYENLRIVGTDEEYIASKTPDEVIQILTDSLSNPVDSLIVVSTDTKVRAE
ncbi:MAG: hypothetical protein BAJATHORv1_10141 [Candidatus Thorarchaeota archaeon]|nr:MAG: hypothetical protein BAJATHORv1_10141 [Candidatus Thorarchaeota archaeon]